MNSSTHAISKREFERLNGLALRKAVKLPNNNYVMDLLGSHQELFRYPQPTTHLREFKIK